MHGWLLGIHYRVFIIFSSAAVAVDSSHMAVSSTTSWSRFCLPSNFVNGHVSTMWFMVCRDCCWPRSQQGDWARPHLCKLARHGPWPIPKKFVTLNFINKVALHQVLGCHFYQVTYYSDKLLSVMNDDKVTRCSYWLHNFYSKVVVTVTFTIKK